MLYFVKYLNNYSKKNIYHLMLEETYKYLESKFELEIIYKGDIFIDDDIIKKEMLKAIEKYYND